MYKHNVTDIKLGVDIHSKKDFYFIFFYFFK